MIEPQLVRKSLTVIDAADDGMALLSYLCGRFTYRDCSQWLAELSSGRLLLNDRMATGDEMLHGGDLLEYRPEPRPEPPADFTVTLLKRMGNLAFLSKSGNLPCHPAGCFFNHTLWAMLKTGMVQGLEPCDDIHFISRLDRETSGVVLVALDGRSAKDALRAMERKDAVKEYRVFVEGVFPEQVTADGWLWTDPDGRVSKRRCFTPAVSFGGPQQQLQFGEGPAGGVLPDRALKPERAVTEFRLIRRWGAVSEVSAVLMTGRTHQIRATLCGMGFHVVGDKLYGADESRYLRFIGGQLTPEDHKSLRIGRQALHAWRLTLLLDGEAVSVEAPLPPELVRLRELSEGAPTLSES